MINKHGKEEKQQVKTVKKEIEDMYFKNEFQKLT